MYKNAEFTGVSNSVKDSSFRSSILPSDLVTLPSFLPVCRVAEVVAEVERWVETPSFFTGICLHKPVMI